MVESHAGGDVAFEPAAFLMVAVEEFEEARLGAGGSLDAAERDALDLLFDPLEVEQEVLEIETEPLADGGELRRLEVGEAEGGQRLVGVAKGGELAHQPEQFAADDFQSFAHLDELGVVGDEAAGGAEVDDRHRFRTELAEDVNVAHDVVAQFALFGGDLVEVDVVEVLFHCGDLGVGDGQPELLLALREHEPEPPPSGVFELRTPEIAHLLACVTVGQRILIDVIVHRKCPFQLNKLIFPVIIRIAVCNRRENGIPYNLRHNR